MQRMKPQRLHTPSEIIPLSPLLLIVATGLFLLEGCAVKPTQPIPRYEGSSDYTGSHGIRAFGRNVKEDVLVYIFEYGTDGWVSGLTDDRFLPGETWPEGGPTRIRVKDLFYAVYECKLHSEDAVTIPTRFDPAEYDKAISKILTTIKANAPDAHN